MAMTELLVSSLTGDRAIAEAASALVVRVENIYEAGGEYFAVDARAGWSSEPFAVSVRDDPDQCPHYVVAAYVAHIRSSGVGGLQRMSSGHYISYVRCGNTWFEMDDAKVTALTEPPTRFPYLVFLERIDRKRFREKLPDSSTAAAAMRELLSARAAAHADLHRAGRQQGDSGGQGRSNRQQNRSARQRDQSGRQQSGRQQDRSGRQQAWRGRVDERVQFHWGSHAAGNNRDHSRSDAYNNLDNPYRRYEENWARRRVEPEVSLKQWSARAEPGLPQPCRLCRDKAFLNRQHWEAHVNEEHGGAQRYRNALFSLLALTPYVARGEEWRSVLANFSEFYARSAMGWDGFTSDMEKRLASEGCLFLLGGQACGYEDGADR